MQKQNQSDTYTHTQIHSPTPLRPCMSLNGILLRLDKPVTPPLNLPAHKERKEKKDRKEGVCEGEENVVAVKGIT